MQLNGQHALVTGGGRGIGRAIASALTAAGATVTITGRTESHLVETVGAGAAHGYAIVDTTEETAMLHAVRKAAIARGAIDILVANAGAAESAPFLKADSTLFRRMLDVNLMGVVHAIHAVLPDMVTRKNGRIISIASVAGLKGYAYVSAYVAAKHAVIGLTRSLALEVAQSGVTVNAVCPGYVETDMVSAGLASITAKTGKSSDEALAIMLKDNPQKRLIKPDEVAAACLWLASKEAAAVNGAVIPITGGEL
jgi:3-hydroxybutyrate dehydrogenase